MDPGAKGSSGLAEQGHNGRASAERVQEQSPGGETNVGSETENESPGTSRGLVDKKILISSQSKKEIENFIPANMKIITQETVFQKALRGIPWWSSG